jgi:ABC-type uncharacterized transport system permease subunit
MDNIIFISSGIILYIVCSALLFIRLRKPAVNSTGIIARLTKKQVLMITLLALCFHSLALYNNMITPAGINMGFYNAISLVSAFITLLTVSAVWRYPVDILAVILLPLTAAAMFIDATNTSSHLLEPDSSSALVFHIITSIIAYSILALAAVQATLLSIQSRSLHAHQPGGIIRLMPPLKNMEVLLFETILVGFVALTISLGSGLIFLENMFAQQLVHKTVLSIFAWFVFLVLLIGHWKLGWRGRTAIRWTLSGFVSLMLAYFGSKFVLEIILV